MRLAGKGIIDRGQTVGFRFDGRDYTGFEGDTLASALLAAGVKLFGRSFKYHRPRGLLSAGSEEPNALVTIGHGAAQVPNARATQVEIHGGLDARSQNRWPSLSLDVMAVNDLMAPFFGAGFYYKTFMWPRSFWEKLYEPAIRRAAGLGALSRKHNEDHYEKAHAFCDLLVIGAGPAGLMAALAAGRAGARVILADEDFLPGGRLNAEVEEVGGQPGAQWAKGVAEELGSLPNVRLMTRTTVTGAYDDGTYGALERVGLHVARAPKDLPRECFWRIVARRAILASGAQERMIAFPMNDRPGVMQAGAVRAYLNRYGVAAGQKVALFAANDQAHRTARDLAAAGIEIAAVIDPRADAPAATDWRVIPGGAVVGTKGRLGLSEISVRTEGGAVEKIAADCLAVSGGWNPALHLACHRNGRPDWRDEIAAFVPRPGMVPGMMVAGAANGAFSTAAALAEGLSAAEEALAALGRKSAKLEAPRAENGTQNFNAYWQVPDTEGRAWLDFANDVTVKDVKLSAQEGFRSVEHMKRYTTQGMAPDQGKNSNVAALAILADATGRAIPETGTTTFRPPYTPVSIAAMGAGGQGKGFAPQRFTTSHKAAQERGAPMIEAGLWYRPSYFPRPGETSWRQSCDREVIAVRNRVGICDVSTLGKIDIQGPDAGRFLDFLYTNSFSTLKPGRVRYGLMLREDGMVMDDGTTACLARDHYLMTTTTAAAGQVMRHIDFVQQAFCADWQVRAISVTEHWAQFAVAGPLARELLNSMLDEPIDAASFPFLSCGMVKIGGVQARLYRISFSGELGYEIAVPARYGEALYRDLVARAESFGGCAYGMEALNVLRIEKGFITHAEIHGRVTAFDIGLQGMVSEKKEFIGKAASQRPGLSGPEREQLVGLKPLGAEKPVTAGAHLFDPGAAPVRENDQGYVTSVCWSPTLQSHLGIGFLKNGRARHGQSVRLVDHLRGIDLLCEVTHPVFFDPDGGRARG
ncbi:sarcosine oxidase subunit alpha family protein [Frigidibacter sp. RF13]|uniref:sarcosine oxidase subunit alpha family protein n=1 Tax=Frigidibacter sp. RF13 TaxID=2997340 RepID=UPI002271E3C7|nr:sarcosine oxidase subunit alpha family protein [Frigidibacter sp. RF13]MCY1127267.1 sarcosine oxidase subunit alpha family protein [Frigidibacter sp. RF13]